MYWCTFCIFLYFLHLFILGPSHVNGAPHPSFTAWVVEWWMHGPLPLPLPFPFPFLNLFHPAPCTLHPPQCFFFRRASRMLVAPQGTRGAEGEGGRGSVLAGFGHVGVHSRACFTWCNFLFCLRGLGFVSVWEIDDVRCLREEVRGEQVAPA